MSRLSDLDPQSQADVARSRLAGTEFLRELAEDHPDDPLIQGANDLDIMAKLYGVYIEYDECLDQEDDIGSW